MKELTSQQIKACHLWLARKENKLTLEQIAQEVGVTRRTIYTWSQTEEWKEYAKEQTISLAKEHLPQVMQNLIRLATTSSSAKHIELFFRVVGVIGTDTMKVEVNNNEPDRSPEAVAREIEELKQMLAENDDDLL